MENLQEVKEEAGKLSVAMIEDAHGMKIETTVSLGFAAGLITQAKNEIKVIEAAFKPHKDNAYKAHKDLCKAETEQLAPFKEIGAILKPKIIEYQNIVEERERLEREAAQAKQREAEAVTQKEGKERKDKEVEALMNAGDFDKAEMVMEAPIQEPMAAIVPEREKVKVAGAGTRKVWKARVLDSAKVPEIFKIVDQKSLDAYAKATQGGQKTEGVEFYQETQLTGK